MPFNQNQNQNQNQSQNGSSWPGGNIPAEFGYRPLTLDFSLEGYHPAWPDTVRLPSPQAGARDRANWYDAKLWDASNYAILANTEFATRFAWEREIPFTDPATLDWQRPRCVDGRQVTPATAVKQEIGQLQQMMENDRERYMPEILSQYDGGPFYWLGLLGLTQGSKPHTLRLMHACLRIGETAAIHYKNRYMRPRPSVLCPGLAPPMGPPGHPAFPSGHSLQGWLVSKWLIQLTKHLNPGYEAELEWIAERVAVNRERAGLHYPSDTSAGKDIAEIIFQVMARIAGIPGLCDSPFLLPQHCANGGPAGPAPVIQTMVAAAAAEWE